MAVRPAAMKITTPLGGDLLFHRMSAREELGRLSELEIDLLSARNDIRPSEILSKAVSVQVELTTQGFRYFNGHVTRFSYTGVQGRYHTYKASVRPWLWFLTRTADCRIFQQMAVPDIVKKVFDDHTVADVKDELTGDYRVRDYCVQYRETDFDFVSRLLEEEGIYYYVRHTAGQHTIVLTDAYSTHQAVPGDELPFVPPGRLRGDQQAVTEWNVGHEVQPGAYVLDDYNFEEPRVERLGRRESPKTHELADYEMFDYPGEYLQLGEGESYARRRLEEMHAQYELVQGATTSRALATGHLFKLKGHPRADQARQYLVVAATHTLEYNEYESMAGGGSSYGCTFTAMSSVEPFRPRRTTRKPLMQGPQTAFVVGPSGQEIHTDEYGRIKVQFHWDRLGEENENSSCWMRVAQPWAGNNWGATFIPRIGQEVVVSFLEGDPDQPLVTGSVYNADQRPPYLGQGRDSKHPNNPSLSGIKTNSTMGGSGYNELRFDDTAGAEQVFIHAQRNYDLRVKNDAMHRVLNDEHTHITGFQREKVEKSAFLEVTEDRHSKIGGGRRETIGADYDLTVKGDENAKVTGTLSLDVGQKLQEKVGQNAALDAGMEIHLKAGMKVIIEAGMQISLKAGANFIDIGPSGVTIVGTMVLINSGGAAGAGSGSSPKAPQEAEAAEPVEAEDSASGSKSAK